MCGILGKIFSKRNQYDKTIFEASLNLMSHRGPDQFDIYYDDNLVFGHRRLSIIDLSENARQPFHSFDNSISMVFNGEIYNYQELKNDLHQSGYKFRTTSDTEVLVNLFHRDGIDCISKLNGMFAICIYNHKDQSTYLIRDRLGIKPLYYYFNQEDKNLTFASEIKSILRLEDKKEFVKNPYALSSYLSFRYPIMDDTFFKEIDCLSAGHYIKFQDNKIKKVKYWNPSKLFELQKNGKSEDYYLSELKSILNSAIQYRMISDVPIGAFLSGGVDSSIVTAIMALNNKEPVKTFTIGFDEEGYNEFKYAKAVSERYKTDHQEIVISGLDYISKMNELISFKDAPLSVPNEIPLSVMSKELKKKITVVLSGEGADELFGGYGRIFRSPHDYRRLLPTNIKKLNRNDRSILLKNAKGKYGEINFSSELDHFYNLYTYMPIARKENILTYAFQNEEIENRLRGKFKFYFDELEGQSYENKIMYSFEMVHLKGLLNRVDNSTMFASVEARVPFVDHRLVEFAFSIPIEYKLKWHSEAIKEKYKLEMSDKISEKADTPKYILKKAYEKEIDHEILYRKKMGFPVPLNNWFGGNFNNYAKEVLLDRQTKARGEIDTGVMEKWLNSDELKKNHSFALQVWMLINNELFNTQYF